MDLFLSRCLSAIAHALEHEVLTTPKPGLVDRRNNGSHPDMNPLLFDRSAKALLPYFEAFLKTTAALSEDFFLPTLRPLGITAEVAMRAATGGINTHKGMIFNLGLVSCAALRLVQKKGQQALHANDLSSLQDLLKVNGQELTGELHAASAKPDGPSVGTDSHGQKMHEAYGVTGARGEAQRGYPCLFQEALPALQTYRRQYEGRDLPQALTLCRLILCLEDTALLKRGGPARQRLFHQRVQRLLASADPKFPNQVLKDLFALDDWAIERNLSPGGAADLLAVTLFLEELLQEGTS
ncbi:Triphosphoribosyl-dephospho-CoA synthase [Clostridiaceae bacterium JG1575]|nr:Triphosphoribosyl-dephospho-CoA synthase [Clostridiaceae bacterium JG1575]